MKNPRVDTQKPENNDDCRLLAPFVMTLFDGEADELQARRARAHLLVCQTCARRWLDWNRSRDLLQNAPVPAPPPQLLWRVLLACRLSRAPHRAPHRAAPKSEVPAHINAQILARTTRVAPGNLNPAPRRAFSPLRFSALAAPALAVWLMALQRDAWLPAPVVAPVAAPIPAASLAPRNIRAPRAASTPKTVSAPRVSIFPSRKAAPSASAPSFARASALSKPLRTVTAAPARPQRQQSRLAPALVAAPSAAAFREVEMGFGAPQTIRLARAPQLTAPPERRLAPRAAIRPAALSGQKRAPLRVRQSPGSSAGTTQILKWEVAAPPQTLRVSLPSAPAPQPARLLAENFESDDARIEEIRSVVEDFRATLGGDNAGGELGAGDEESTG